MKIQVLISISNHPVSGWGEEQRAGWEEIIEIPFPNVLPEDDIIALAEKVISQVSTHLRGRVRLACDFVFFVAGEARLTYCLTDFFLRKEKARCVVATTRRESVEEVQTDGSVKKTAIFRFLGWSQMETSNSIDRDARCLPGYGLADCD